MLLPLQTIGRGVSEAEGKSDESAIAEGDASQIDHFEGRIDPVRAVNGGKDRAAFADGDKTAIAEHDTPQVAAVGNRVTPCPAVERGAGQHREMGWLADGYSI